MRILLLVLAALCLALPAFAELAETPRPNVVLILADDLGWTDLGCQGSAYYQTPHLDAMAAAGLRFTRYYASPNCVPSRAALMTGQYAPRTGLYTVGSAERGKAEDRALIPPQNQTLLPRANKTIAEVLKGAGYATGMFGKWHLGGIGDEHPSARGFDEAIASQGAHFDFRTDPTVDHPGGEYLADFLTARAVDFIARHKDTPFFLYLPHFAVHAPIDAKPAYVAEWEKRPPAGTHWNAEYAAMIQSIDESVGAVLAALAEHGLAENTLVLFTSDNGGVGSYDTTEAPTKKRGVTSNAPLRGGKGTLYEGGVREPFIARWPGVIPAGTVSDTPIAHIDLLPTIAALCGAPLSEGPIDGVSLAPLLRDPAAPLAREALYLHFPVYLESYVHARGWRTTPGSYIIAGDWKLIEYLEGPRLELYNLREDIGETQNLAAAEPERAAQLRAQLDTWRKGIGAAMPTRK